MCFLIFFFHFKTRQQVKFFLEKKLLFLIFLFLGYKKVHLQEERWGNNFTPKCNYLVFNSILIEIWLAS
jgi:hypothetical protein